MTLRYSPAAPGAHHFSVTQSPVLGKEGIALAGSVSCSSNSRYLYKWFVQMAPHSVSQTKIFPAPV